MENAYAKSLQSCPTLCNAMDCSPPGSSVHGILYATIMVWVAISYTGDLSNPRIKPTSLVSPALAGRFFTSVPPIWEALLLLCFKFFIEIENYIF